MRALGGWTEGFLAEGYRVQGFDIEAHDYGTGGYPGELFLRDVRSLHGSQFKDAAIIVGSSPCQEFSYRAMPWKRAKALGPPLLGIELFQAQFRIQREASEAAGRYIPLIVENVRGAQKWVGRAKANFGSFYLWGDVGMVGRRVVAIVDGKFIAPGISAIKGTKVPGFRFDGSGKSFQTASVEGIKLPGNNVGMASECEGQKVAVYSDPRRNGGKGSHMTCQNENMRRLEEGIKVGMAPARDLYADRDTQGVKQHGSGHIWYRTGNGALPSKSNRRKAASALIAKIPFPLAQHIAHSFLPQ